jgi:hypothetical protein
MLRELIKLQNMQKMNPLKKKKKHSKKQKKSHSESKSDISKAKSSVHKHENVKPQVKKHAKH